MFERKIYNSETNEIMLTVRNATDDETFWKMAAFAYEFGELREPAYWVEI